MSNKSARRKASADATPRNGNRVSASVSTPSVTFNREMTAAKRAMLARTPLSRLLRGDHDATSPALSAAASKPENAGRSGKRNVSSKMNDANLSKKQKHKLVGKSSDKNSIPDASDGRSELGVVYLGHLPHGFYEKEMRGYFSQFGEITRLRLSRSRKSARSRGYAFIEFASADVAKITAEAMDGYLMFGRALVAKYVSPDRVHEKTWLGADKTFRRIPWAAMERERNLRAAKIPKKLKARTGGIAKALHTKQERLKKLGIDYKFPTFQEAPASLLS